MTELDWMIVAFAAILALLGFRQGFVIGALSFAGFALGAFLGTRLGPLLLPRGSASPYAPAFGLFGALVLGAAFARGFEGVAMRIRASMVLPGLGALDGALGAVLGAVLALGIAWIAAALAAQTSGPGGLRADIQRSEILRHLNEVLPPTGGILNALARLDALPAIPGPNPDVAPPTSGVLHTAGVRGAQGSVVRVLGSACGLAVEGSGWVAAPGLVVTNAHVVAGEQDTRIEGTGGTGAIGAGTVVFEPRKDIAILSVPGFSAPPLRLVGDAAAGTNGAILGYPENGPFTATAARIGRTQEVQTDDVYGNPVMRLLTPLRGEVRPGNSGGPVVDAHGAVLTTVFAGTVGSRHRGGYGVANATVAGLLGTARARAERGVGAETGQCTTG